MLSEENWFIEFEHVMFNQVPAEINPVLVIERVVDEEWWKILTPKEARDRVDELWVSFIGLKND